MSAGLNHFNGDTLVLSFSHLMFAGRVKPSLRLLNESGRNTGTPLSLNPPISLDDPSVGTFFNSLQKKHPEPDLISHHHVLLLAIPPPDHDSHFISFE